MRKAGCSAAVRSLIDVPAVLPASVRRAVRRDSSLLVVVPCTLRVLSRVVLREPRAPALASAPASASVPASVSVLERARLDSFRLRVKRRVRNGRVVSSAVDVSNTQRPKKAR